MLKFIWVLLYNYLLSIISYFRVKDKTRLVITTNKIRYLLQQYNTYLKKKYPIRIRRVQVKIKDCNPYRCQITKYCCICGPKEDTFFEEHYRINKRVYCYKCRNSLIILLSSERKSSNRIVATLYLGNRDIKSTLNSRSSYYFHTALYTIIKI